MPHNRQVVHPKVFGVTETSITLCFGVAEGDALVDAEARVRLDDEVRAVSHGAGTRLVRIDDLEPGTEYSIRIESGDASAGESRYFPGGARTLEAPRAQEVASFATMNDLHFGEPRFGGMLTDDHEYGDAAPGFPVVQRRRLRQPVLPSS